MKKLSILILSILLLSTGCKTTSNPTGIINGLNPEMVSKSVEIAAKIGTYSTIKADINSVTYFKIAQAVIAVSIINNNYTNIDSTINRVTGNVLVTEAIKDAIDLYQIFYGQVVTNKINDKSIYIIPILSGISDGIESGIKLSGF